MLARDSVSPKRIVTKEGRSWTKETGRATGGRNEAQRKESHGWASEAQEEVKDLAQTRYQRLKATRALRAYQTATGSHWQPPFPQSLDLVLDAQRLRCLFLRKPAEKRDPPPPQAPPMRDKILCVMRDVDAGHVAACEAKWLASLQQSLIMRDQGDRPQPTTRCRVMWERGGGPNPWIWVRARGETELHRALL